MPGPVFPWNDVWETSAEIPYWWSTTVLLIGWSNFQPIRSTSQIWVMTQQISMEFLHLFLRCHFAGKPVKASQNVGCFLTGHSGMYGKWHDLLLPQIITSLEKQVFIGFHFCWFDFSEENLVQKKHGNINFGQCWSLLIMYAKLFLNMIAGNPCYLNFFPRGMGGGSCIQTNWPHECWSQPVMI